MHTCTHAHTHTFTQAHKHTHTHTHTYTLTHQAKQMPILDYLTAFDKYVYCVYLFIFSNLVALISIVVFFRDQLEAPESVPFELREHVLGISMRTGAYAFVSLFVVFLPFWVMYLSNSMAGTGESVSARARARGARARRRKE